MRDFPDFVEIYPLCQLSGVSAVLPDISLISLETGGDWRASLVNIFKYCAYSGNSFLLWSWGVLPIMDYTGRLRTKGVPHLDWRYIKGMDFMSWKYRKGLEKLSFRYEKGLSKYLEQTQLTADSPKYFRLLK